MELAQLAVFVRPPVVGAAKTRLADALGEGGAASLYEAFVDDIIELCRRVREAGPVDVALWAAGPEDPALSEWARRLDTSVRRQPDGDLGIKLAAAFDEGLQRFERVVVIGSDVPTLPLGLVVAAFDSLQDHSLALGPANDGGYYAIGAARGASPRFDGVRWSTADAFRDTLSANANHDIGILPPWYDIDERDDLEVLRAHLSTDPAAAPATARRLAELRASHK